MGSLSNLYISQSYQSLLHFGTDTSASATLIEVEDGVGNGLGVYLNTLGELKATTSISSSTIEATNLVIKNKIELTGSIDVDGPVTASNAFIENNLIVSGTLFANKVVTLIESSSIIYSSGSNILGDETSDTQTLIGLVRVSGSSQLTGSMGITGDLNVLGNISSSTISGIGNVTIYSASVQSFIFSVSSSISGTITTLSQSIDSRLDFLEGPFSTSVDFRLDELETWSSSLQTTFVTETQLTQTRSLIEGQMTVTASFLQNQINQKLNTSSFNAYTQSTDNRINVLSSFTASYATTGSNTFNGNQTINGTLLVSSSMVYSGSVRGRVITLNVTSQTASMDLSLGNFFSLTLPTSSTTYLNPINIQPGETVQLLVKQQSPTGSLNYPSSLLFPTGSDYSASVFANSQDILSFVTFDTASIYAVSIKNLI